MQRTDNVSIENDALHLPRKTTDDLLKTIIQRNQYHALHSWLSDGLSANHILSDGLSLAAIAIKAQAPASLFILLGHGADVSIAEYELDANDYDDLLLYALHCGASSVREAFMCWDKSSDIHALLKCENIEDVNDPRGVYLALAHDTLEIDIVGHDDQWKKTHVSWRHEVNFGTIGAESPEQRTAVL